MPGQELLDAGGQQHGLSGVRRPGRVLGQQVEVLPDVLAVAHERQQQGVGGCRGGGDGVLDGLVGLPHGWVDDQ
jgi:hypothetical protein